MNPGICQSLRLLTGSATVFLVANESPIWWVGVIPWAVLCVFGIFATVPLVCLVGMGAGAAQADWMSDAFLWGLLFVTPTLLAIGIAEVCKRWSFRGDRCAARDHARSSTRSRK